MNFLKISGLVIGAGSVVGGTGAGIYYVSNSEKINEEKKSNATEDQKLKFIGKLVFKNKSIDGTSANYEVKLLAQDKYLLELKTFDTEKENGKKYENINKIVDISYDLKISEAKMELNGIFGESVSLKDAKTKITEKAVELKRLFGETIYAEIENKIK